MCNSKTVFHFPSTSMSLQFSNSVVINMAGCRLRLLVNFAIFAIVFCFNGSWAAENCSAEAGKYDLTPLSRFVWNVTRKNGPDIINYKISLCSRLSLGDGCSNSSVCRLQSNGSQLVSLGNYSELLNSDQDADDKGFWLKFEGSAMPQGGRYHALINLQCGENLGSPQFIGEYGCSTYFLWKSSAACDYSSASRRKAVPCYAYDSLGNKHDLSRLAKKVGGYQLKSSVQVIDFFINVCTDISPDERTTGCPGGVGACRKIGAEVVGFGDVNEPLQITDSGSLQLNYTSSPGTIPPTGCVDAPTTVITFICPESGMGESPVILSDSDCNYQIQWVTEQACPVKQLESSSGCTLESKIDGIKVDLTALKSDGVIPRNALGKIGASVYNFYIGICGGLPVSFPCATSASTNTTSGNATTICRKGMDSLQSLVIGSSTNQTLRYADDQLYLTYTSATPCSLDSSRNRTHASVIFFNCGNGRGNNAVGVPRLIQEEECTTFFEWETRFACIERMLGGLCFVGDGQNIFDLSSLRRGHGEAPWQAIIDDPWMPPGTQLYINVCGPVGLSGDAAGCPAGAAVCLKDIGNRTHDYGQYMNRPHLDPLTHDVYLNYTSLEMCGNQTRTTSIKFVCSPGGRGLSPRLVRLASSRCELVIEWPTAAACTQATTSGDDCKVRASDLGLSFDLSPLRHANYYNVSHGNYTFYLNVCGPLKEAPCVAQGDEDKIGGCQMEKKGQGKYWSIGKPSSRLAYYNGIVNLTLTDGTTYNDKQQTPRQTVVIFMCDRTAGVGQPKFVVEANHVYSFKWKTSLVCPSQPLQCIYTDRATQTQYDLSSLMRTQDQSDWNLGDRSLDKTKTKFYVNVCRRLTLADKAEAGCSSQAGICATRANNGKEEVSIANLGRPLSGPEIVDRQLVLKYSSGDPCPLGMGLNYSAIIYFMCPADLVSRPSETSQGPNFLRNVNCEHMFLWSTQAACPLKSTVQQGHSCSVLDPRTGLTFSLAALNRTFSIDATKLSEFKNFSINVCGSLDASRSCGGRVSTEGVFSACGTTIGNQLQILGLNATRQVTVSGEGQVTVSFNGTVDPMTDTPLYSIRILFLCRRHLESSAPRFVGQDGRVLLFEYETAITCPPQPVDCTLRDARGNTYDLSSLKSQSNHWDVRDTRPGQQNLIYHISVCQALKVSAETNCPPGVIGACLSNMTSGEGFNLGYIQGTPRMSNDGQGTISLRYLNGDPCVRNPDIRLSTRIDFLCSSKIGEPKFIAETATCEHVFAWETPAACASQQSIGRGCRVADTSYSTEFDLGRLKNNGGYKVSAGGKTFTVSLCSAVPMDCGGDQQAGVCLESDGQRISGGKWSDQPIYDRGEISLRYTGDNRSSIILFQCDHTTTGEQGPAVLFNTSSNNNFFLFTWKTSYACRRFKSSACHVMAPDNSFYDLSDLSLHDDNHKYITYDGAFKYLINVCRSLVHQKDSMCHYGSAVCGINLTEPNVDKKYANLGEVSNGPIFENGVLKLVYGMGEICRIPGSPILHKQTTIEFHCEASIKYGEPSLVDDKGCEYLFTWYTAAACPVKQEDVVVGDCTTTNPNTGFRFDFTALRNMSYEVTMNGNLKFHLGVCGPPPGSPCRPGSGSCVDDGKRIVDAGIANSNLHYHDGVLMLNYSGGEPCANSSGTGTTIVTFVCGSPGSDHGQPVFVDNPNCLYYVNWHTDLACERQVHCSVEVDNEVFDLSSLVEKQGHAYAFGSDEHDDGSYMINVCQPLNPYAGILCPTGAAACRVDPRTRTAVSLGKVDRSPTVDEQGHVILEYRNGSACLANPHLNASTRIIFVCSGIINSPVPQMIELTTDCTYVFEWPTEAVCPSRSHGNLTSNCTYFDNRSQMHFDLPQLHHNASSSGFQVQTDEGEFTISLCGSVATQGPCSTSGVCLERNSHMVSWGSAMSKIFVYEGHILKVFFKNGDVCPSGGGKRISTVWFKCDEKAGTGKPELSESSECHAVFLWKTSITCPKLTNRCAVMNQGRLYDLRLLSSHSHSWTIDESRDEKFWINICNGLAGENDPRCPIGSSVCWKSSYGKVQSIGATESQELVMSADNKSIILKYSTPTNVCVLEHRATTPTYSEIHFVCGVAGSPKLVTRGNYANCTFTFEWTTPLACGELRKIEILQQNGKVEDSALGLSVDLTPLLESTSSITEEREQDHYVYEINLNGLLQYRLNSKCAGSSVCQTRTGDLNFQRNLGSANRKKLFAEGSELQVILESDNVCGRNSLRNVSSRFIMQCSPSAGVGLPVIAYESVDCVYVFNWENSYVCDLISLSQQNVMPIHATGSSNVGIAIGISVLIIIVAVVLFLVFRKRERRVTVASHLHALLRKRQIPTFRYSALATDDTDNEVTALLAQRSSRRMSLSDGSDDELLEL